MAEPLNATFFAFRKREPGGTLLRTSVVFLVVAVVLLAGFAALFWASLGPLVTWYGEIISAAATNDSTAMQNASLPPGFFTLILGILVWTFFFYILFAAYEAACLKWMIHGETGGFMGLSLGADTWRVWGVYWFWFLLNMAFSIVMQIVMMILMGVMAVSSSGDPTAMMSVLPVFFVLQYGLMIFFAVRLAPAAATSIARRRFSFFDAWKVTRGRFWPMLGSFVLLYVIYAVAAVVLFAVFLTVVLGSGTLDLSALSDPTRAGEAFQQFAQTFVQSLAKPQMWIILGALQVLSLVVGIMLYLAMFGVNAAAARAALDEGTITPAT